ncbi:hypothetical protein FA95DRAFT_650323 [Auriscalpium vulgare]|uniref:Uncharacterized protein n=1 Tax=Auriscalpium vulgare TaxID=40419 RepID=A0ACB8RD56_9AGAM|nr:hypothetical protein FA95DRAFT_650323 [Auriscalpium vulgare]
MTYDVTDGIPIFFPDNELRISPTHQSPSRFVVNADYTFHASCRMTVAILVVPQNPNLRPDVPAITRAIIPDIKSCEREANGSSELSAWVRVGGMPGGLHVHECEFDQRRHARQTAKNRVTIRMVFTVRCGGVVDFKRGSRFADRGHRRQGSLLVRERILRCRFER